MRFNRLKRPKKSRTKEEKNQLLEKLRKIFHSVLVSSRVASGNRVLRLNNDQIKDLEAIKEFFKSRGWNRSHFSKF